MNKIKLILPILVLLAFSCEKQSADMLVGTEWFCESEFYDIYLKFTTDKDAEMRYDYKSGSDRTEHYRYEVDRKGIKMIIGGRSLDCEMMNGDEYLMITYTNSGISLGLFKNTKYYEPPKNLMENTSWEIKTAFYENGVLINYLVILSFKESEALLSLNQISINSSWEAGMLSYMLPYDYTFDDKANNFTMYGKEGGFVTNGEEIIYFEDIGFKIWDAHGYLNDSGKSITFYFSDDIEPLILFPSDGYSNKADAGLHAGGSLNMRNIDLLPEKLGLIKKLTDNHDQP